jgi:transposase-like protein
MRGGHQMAARGGAGERRRTRSLDERKRIVEEALAPGISVAAVARRHGLNANLIFKWIRRSREGWRDRRREPAKEKPVVAALPERGGSAFVPVKLLELERPQRRRLPMSQRSRLVRRAEARGAARWRSACRTAPRCRSTLRSTPRRSVAFCRRWASLDAPVRAGREGLSGLQACGHAARL